MGFFKEIFDTIRERVNPESDEEFFDRIARNAQVRLDAEQEECEVLDYYEEDKE